MICSFSQRFLFIKTRKTGGTSIEIAVSKHCGDRDIITPISPEDEMLRLDDGRLAQNYSSHRYRELLYRTAVRLRRQGLAKRVLRWDVPHPPFYNHMSLGEVRALIPAPQLASLRSFTIERHPYEKVISLAYFSRKTKHHRGQALPAVIDAVIAERKYLNFPLYTVGGKVAVDRVLRYEHLADDFGALLRDFGLPPAMALPNAKGSFRDTKQPAAELLSEAQKQAIRRDAAFELEHFKYAT